MSKVAGKQCVPGKILNSKFEILNNIKIQMFKIPNVSVIRIFFRI